MVLIRVIGMCRPGFRRGMAGLALVAMLALALVPTLGRLAGALPDGTAAAAPEVPMLAAGHGMDHALGHGTGHAMDHGAGHGQPAAPHEEPAPGDPDSPHGGHGDCAYCPLLASILLLAVIRLPQETQQRDGTWSRPLRVVRLGFTHPCGLGSRGPPVS